VCFNDVPCKVTIVCELCSVIGMLLCDLLLWTAAVHILLLWAEQQVAGAWHVSTSCTVADHLHIVVHSCCCCCCCCCFTWLDRACFYAVHFCAVLRSWFANAESFYSAYHFMRWFLSEHFPQISGDYDVSIIQGGTKKQTVFKNLQLTSAMKRQKLSGPTKCQNPSQCT